MNEHVSRPVSLFMADKKGGYLAFGADNFTHMQGLFFFDSEVWSPYKTIESIRLGKQPSKLINNFSTASREYDDGTKETFTTLNNCMLYSVENFKGAINITLDFRHMFDFADKGRIYSITEKEGIIIVKYEKFIDDSLSVKDKTAYLAISGAKEWNKLDSWERREYQYDKSRNSKCEFYVYNALEIILHGSANLCFAYAKTEDDAAAKAVTINANRHEMLAKMDEYMTKSYRHKDLIQNIALKSADDLLTHPAPQKHEHGKQNRDTGIFAGLPWFYQFWSRDELISLNAFIMAGRYSLSKQIIMSYVQAISQDGLLPNRLPESEIRSLDSIGWLFIRIDTLITDLIHKKALSKYFDPHELNNIRSGLEKAIHGILHYHAKDGLVAGQSQESWMDTREANRTGSFIECQCFLLRMMSLHTRLSEKSGQKQLFRHDLSELKDKVRSAFFKGGMLLDTAESPVDKNAQRPNIFLAYHAYPHLLTKEEWKSAFDICLKETWLDWGGLATLGHTHPSFCQQYTGENDRSYHNGDSWFFVNNLAALAMNSVDAYSYDAKIKRILHASREEMLFSGFAGCSAELSSAKDLRSEGCLSQAWSIATFYELERHLGQKN